MRGDTAPVTCHGKKVFYSYPAAQKAARSLNRNEESAHAGPYRCHVCHFYHVGNSMNSKKDKRLFKGERDGGEQFSEQSI